MWSVVSVISSKTFRSFMTSAGLGTVTSAAASTVAVRWWQQLILAIKINHESLSAHLAIEIRTLLLLLPSARCCGHLVRYAHALTSIRPQWLQHDFNNEYHRNQANKHHRTHHLNGILICLCFSLSSEHRKGITRRTHTQIVCINWHASATCVIANTCTSARSFTWCRRASARAYNLMWRQRPTEKPKPSIAMHRHSRLQIAFSEYIHLSTCVCCVPNHWTTEHIPKSCLIEHGRV